MKPTEKNLVANLISYLLGLEFVNPFSETSFTRFLSAQVND